MLVIVKSAPDTTDGKRGIKLVGAFTCSKNKIFINAYLIKSGLASCDPDAEHQYKSKFHALRPTATIAAKRRRMP